MHNLFEQEEIGFSPQNPFGSVAVAQMWHRGTPPQERAGKIIYFRVSPSILKKLPYDEQGNPGRSENVNLQESKLRKIIAEEINKVLQEDLGTGSNQSYTVAKDYRAIEVLKQTLGKEVLGRNWGVTGCSHWARDSVKKTIEAINQAIAILQEK